MTTWPALAALELVDRLTRLSQRTERDKMFVALRADIKEDQEVLKQLLVGLGGKRAILERQRPG